MNAKITPAANSYGKIYNANLMSSKPKGNGSLSPDRKVLRNAETDQHMGERSHNDSMVQSTHGLMN